MIKLFSQGILYRNNNNKARGKNMNKKLIALLFAGIFMLSSCAREGKLEEQEADVKATVEDSRSTTVTETTAEPTTAEPTTAEPPTEAATQPSTAATTKVTTTKAPATKPAVKPVAPATVRREHSYGVAKNGKPHRISVDNQKYFDSVNLDAFCLDTVTQSKVLYLTFDCGWENGCTTKVLDTLKEKNVPAAFFCTLDHIESEPKLIKRMIDEGHIVGNHSANHADFTKISHEKMTSEVKICENYLVEKFGYTPTFFRYPEGAYTEDSLAVIKSLGYKTAFWSCAYADWDVSNPKGGDYAFNTVTARLHPGAVILLHSVSPDNAEALGRIIDYAREQGYEFKALTDFPV